MAKRLTEHVIRGKKIALTLNGRSVEAYAGENLVTVMLMAGDPVCKTDRKGLPRAPFCNMGVCYDCLVEVSAPSHPARRVRACMTTAQDGMNVTSLTAGQGTGHD